MSSESFNYYCPVCKYGTDKLTNYNIHIETNKHILALESLKDIYYHCSDCSYSTNKLSNWKRHLNSKKHKVQVSACKGYKCNTCNKSYVHQSSYCRHIKKCSNKLLEENIKLKNKISHFESHKPTTSIISENNNINTINNITNNITHNINNNVNNIIILLNDKCKDAMNLTDFVDQVKLSIEDLVFTKTNGYVNGISNIFIKNLESLEPNDRPIHCSNLRNMKFYVKDEDRWEENNGNVLNNSIDSLTQKQIVKVKDWVDENPSWNKTEEGQTDYMTLINKVCVGGSDEKILKDKEKIKRIVGKQIIFNKQQI